MGKNETKKIVGTTTLEEALETFASTSEENRVTLNASLKLNELMERMVEERKYQRMTQREFAEVVGIKQPMIARIEKLESIPRLDTFIKMADKLDLEILLAPKVDFLPIDFEMKSIKYSSFSSDKDVYSNPIDYGRCVKNERIQNAA